MPGSLGCYSDRGPGLLILSRGDEDTLQHELRHWMGECSGVGHDELHENEAMWYGGVL
jgi:hypothetical protein